MCGSLSLSLCVSDMCVCVGLSLSVCVCVGLSLSQSVCMLVCVSECVCEREPMCVFCACVYFVHVCSRGESSIQVSPQ